MLFVFDVNETLLDLAPIDDYFERETGIAGIRSRWFDLMIRSAIVATAADEYRDFGMLGAECAKAVTAQAGRALSDEAVTRLGAAMRTLPAHSDVFDGLTWLRRHGHRLVALGNSPLATVTAQLANADLTPLFDAMYSAEQARVLKPGGAAYRYVLESEHVDPDAAVMVAAHDWDIAGAHSAGMRTVLLARPGVQPLPGYPAPTATAANLGEIAQATTVIEASQRVLPA